MRHRDDRAEPLPLQLPAPPPLPGRIAPEVAVPCSAPFDGERWRFSIDWDGSRALLFVGAGGDVHLQSERLADLTPRFPELLGAGAALRGSPMVLDGVVAVLDPRGRPDLESLGLRLVLGGDGADQLPAVFLAADVLHVAGASTLSWPLDRRLATLSECVGEGAMVQAPDHVEGRGLAFADAAAERGLTALLARRGDAPYRPGMASPDRLHVALRQRAVCVVAGIEEVPDERWEIVLAEYVAGTLTFSGTVAGPRHDAVHRWLLAGASGLGAHASAPAGSDDVRARWLRPALAATVAHHGRLPNGRLRDPTLIAVRDDVDVAWCVRREAVPPPDDSVRGRFAPTVLMPLPLGDAALSPRPAR